MRFERTENAFGYEFAKEYQRSRAEYEAAITEVRDRIHIETEAGVYSTIDSRLLGPNGYFEPHEKFSFYDIDNPYPPNDDEEISIDDFVARTEADKKRSTVVIADFMGTGAGSEVADHVFSASMSPVSPTDGHTHFVGDALSTSVEKELVTSIARFVKSNEHAQRPAVLHTVFFRPIRAMLLFRRNLYALVQLYDGLRALYAMQPDGGRQYIQIPDKETLGVLKEMFNDAGCGHVLTDHPNGSPLVRIIKDRGTPRLPRISKKYADKLLAICLKRNNEVE